MLTAVKLTSIVEVATGTPVVLVYAITGDNDFIAHDHEGKEYRIPAGKWTCIAEEANGKAAYLVLFEEGRMRPALFENADEVASHLDEAHNLQFPNNPVVYPN